MAGRGLWLWMLYRGGGGAVPWDLGDATEHKPYGAGYLFNVLLCRLQAWGIL
jgi:hypothetical protein